LRKSFIVALVFIIVSPLATTSQTRRRGTTKRSDRVTKPAAEKPARERLATQIKTLTQFLYLLGGVTKGIESADQAARERNASSLAIEQNDRNKTKVKESIRNVREGLERLETDFRINQALKNYYAYLSGVAMIAETAENQAAANRFDEAGRSLLKAVNQLADALAAMR
jgi:hypothetical protein